MSNEAITSLALVLATIVANIITLIGNKKQDNP
jgi:hypothetical protein